MERLGVELDQTAPPAVVEAVSPFAGLNYYTESDAEWFFGRTDEAQTIVGNLRAARLTMLYSQSGVGKSSVLRAGVTHELIELAHRRRAQGRRIGYVPVVFNNWKDDPVDELIRAIERASAPFACGARVALP